MKIQPLYDLQQEINRLFIAGSKFSKNDPRLSKLIPVFEKLGEKAPVFKKLAFDIDALTKAEAAESAEKLTTISTLLYSVLYTQGEMTETEVEHKEQEPHFDLKDIKTLYSYLELKPAIKALSESSQGRLEVVKEAKARGIFKDFRTYAYLDKGLGDKYAELAAYIENVIKEEAGKTIVPILLNSFSYEGRSEDVRRLSLLNHFRYEGIKGMIDKIMQGDAANLQAEAIKILSENVSNEDFIIELTSDKNKIIREAAYMGLAQLNTEKSQNKLKELYIKNRNRNKTNFELLVNALRHTDMKFTFNEIFEEVQNSFKEFININKEENNKIFVDAIENLRSNISILSQKNKPEVYGFLTNFLLDKNYNGVIKEKANLLSRYAENISYDIINLIASFSDDKRLLFYENIHKNMPSVSWKTPFYKNYFYESIHKGYPPAEIYDMFIKAYDAQFITLDDLIKGYSGKKYEYYANVSDIKDVSIIDRRWIDKLYKKAEKNKNGHVTVKMLQLIDAYEPVPCEKFNELLKTAAKQIEIYSVPAVFKMIMKRDLPDKYEFIYSVIKNSNFGRSNYYYGPLVESEIWNEFPKEYANKFNEMNNKNKFKIFEEIANKIEVANG